MSTENKMSRRHLLKGLLGVAVVSPILAACQPKVVKETVVVEKVVEKEVTRVVEKQAPAAKGDIVIKAMVRAGYGGDIYRLFVTNFNNANPGLRAETVDTAYGEMLKKTQAMYAAGTTPDMLTTAVKWFPYMSEQGVYMPLDDLLKPHWEEYEMDDIYPFALDAQRFEGTLYGIPEICMPCGRPLVAYNIDMFEAAGVSLPDEKEYSIFDWKEAALKLTKPDEGIYGMSPPGINSFYDWDAFVDGFGSHILTEEVGLAKKFNWLDDPKVKDAWDWYADVAIEHHGTPRRGETLEKVNMFSAGRLATSKDGIYHINGLPQEVGDKFRYGLTLMKGPVRKGSGAFSNAFCVSSQTKIPEEALKVAVYLTSTEVGVYSAVHALGRGLQARRSQWKHKDVLAMHPIYGVVAEFMEEDLNNFPHPWNLRFQELFDTYNNQVQPLMYGEKTWDEQAPVIQAKCQEIMDLARP